MEIKEKIIHLYIINECGKKCPMCCNKFYDIDAMPVATVSELKSADTVCLTGGDPFLYDGLSDFVKTFREQYPNIKKMYAYTSGHALFRYIGNHWLNLIGLDGVSIAPKDVGDWLDLRKILSDNIYKNIIAPMTSNRLMVFDSQKANFDKFMAEIDLSMFTVLGRKWDSKFITPDNEIFRRLPILFSRGL